MRRVPVDRLRPGMTVGHSVYNTRGDILLQRGVTLTPAYIRGVAAIGIPALYVDDGLVPGLDMEDVIAGETRQGAVRQLKEMWAGGPPVLAEADTARLRETVHGILDELLASPPVMVNLTDIRGQDDYLFAHSVNVCVLSLVTGRSLGLDRAGLLLLGLGALLHDVGKLLIPRDILDKPGRLDHGEFALVKKHPEYSHRIVAEAGEIPALIALQHHERVSGHGYPAGLAGESVHRLAQIVGLTDIYDAMTADRVYRPAHRPNDVYQMLAASGGHYFAFELVQAFLAVVAAYPRGAVVRLNSGETAVVVDTPPGSPLYPRVKVVFDRAGRRLKDPYDLELVRDIDRSIVRIIDNDEVEEPKAKGE